MGVQTNVKLLEEEKLQLKEDLCGWIEELQSSVKLLEEEKAKYIPQLKILKKTEKNVVELRKEIEQMKFEKQNLLEKVEELQSSVKLLEEVKANQYEIVKTMTSENMKYIAQLKILKEAEKNVVELQKENEQVKLQNEFLNTSQKEIAERMDSLIIDYEAIRKELKEEKEVASVWREQVTVKNDSVVIENEMLRQRSGNLQQIVDEEVGDNFHDSFNESDYFEGMRF